MDPDLNAKIDRACQIAKEFSKLYYRHMDKTRHQISKLYMDTGVLVWNGNATAGSTKIQEFILQLPVSEHTLTTLDAQPVTDDAVSSQLTYVIQVSGNVRYQDYQDRADKAFQQTFIITTDPHKLKIVSDCFRLQGPVPKN